MKNKKLTIALISVAIIVAVSVVGVTFAIWDTTHDDNNFSIKIGPSLDFSIQNQVDDNNSLKNFAPITTTDVTKAITTAKLASFDVVTKTTTDKTSSDTKLSYTDVTVTYTVVAKGAGQDDFDLSEYIDLYLLQAGAYGAFVDGAPIAVSTGIELIAPPIEGATLLPTKVQHSIAGVKQGIVIAWKSEIISNTHALNLDLINKIANKDIVVTLEFKAIINAAV